MGVAEAPVALAHGRPPRFYHPKPSLWCKALAPHFSNPTYQRFSTLLVGALLTTGRRTVANVLRTLRHLAPGHPTDYQRVLSRSPWSGLELGCVPVRFLLDHLVPDGPVALVGDDTVDGHKGPRVYGKGRHRDAVRSTHSDTARRYGHRWVVLAVLVKFPFAARRWALPVLVDLYRPPEVSEAEGRRHRTPAQLMCRLLRLLLARFPGRAFVFAGDSGYGTHEVARFCCRQPQIAQLAAPAKSSQPGSGSFPEVRNEIDRGTFAENLGKAPSV